MCTSLECGSQWWLGSSSGKAATKSSGGGDQVSSLQHLVEDLRSQLSHAQGVICRLQSRVRSLSISSEYGPSMPCKVSWSFQESASQSEAEDNEAWPSSEASPHKPEQDLQRLVTRVDALEDQLMKGGQRTLAKEGMPATWPG